MNPKTQFKWDGTENTSEIFLYSCSLGPKAFQFPQAPPHILQFSKEEAISIRDLYRRSYSNVVIPSLTESEQEALKITEKQLYSKLSDFIQKIVLYENSSAFFLKTNRHSCKDSPLDHPTERDLSLFEKELSKYEVPAIEIPLEKLDFSIPFEAMCKSRIRSIRVETAEEIISLLTRSKRIHDDICLQLELCLTPPWDFYLALHPFDDSIVDYCLNEFRCFISGKKLRCISQYSYLIKCPIEEKFLTKMAETIADFINFKIIPFLKENIVDAAVDVQVVPKETGFEVKLIETNPLGPGTVWGVLDWNADKGWLLGEKELPGNRVIKSNRGECYEIINVDMGKGKERFVLVVCKEIEKEFGFGGSAHIPPDYLLVVWKHWRIEDRENMRKKK